MIRATDRLESFERRYAAQRARSHGYREALAMFRALWSEAAALNPDFPSDWRKDVEADVELARVLNGLSRSARMST